MNRKCAIVQDLLVLYEDDVLRSESRRMVEEHIETCEECRKVYEKAAVLASDIRDALPEAGEPMEKSEKDWDEMAVKAVSGFRRKMTFEHIIVGGLFFIVFILATNLAGYLTADGDGIRSIFTGMPADEIDVKEIYRLKNGEIYMVLSSEKGFQLSYIPNLESPERHGDTNEAYYHVRFTKAYGWLSRLQNLESVKEAAYIFPVETRVRDYLDEDKVCRWSCNEISCVGPFKYDKKVLWREGEEVPEAPPEIEEKAIAAYARDGDFRKAWEEIEKNEESGNTGMYKAYKKYYPDEESVLASWQTETACEVYEKSDNQE